MKMQKHRQNLDRCCWQYSLVVIATMLLLIVTARVVTARVVVVFDSSSDIAVVLAVCGSNYLLITI